VRDGSGCAGALQAAGKANPDLISKLYPIMQWLLSGGPVVSIE
jgi:hypothetical protein